MKRALLAPSRQVVLLTSPGAALPGATQLVGFAEEEHRLEQSASFDVVTGTPLNPDARRLCALRWVSGAPGSVREMAFDELREATDGFGEKRRLGTGGSCVVLRGDVYGLPVAIKRLHPVQTTFARAQFEAEMQVRGGSLLCRGYPGTNIATTAANPASPLCACLCRPLQLLCTVSHDNICRLFAFSTDGPSRCLVLELCTGGALDTRLACKPAPSDGSGSGSGNGSGSGAPQPLQWAERLHIATGIASALVHLHTLSPPMLHRDLKTANVLLDEMNNAKVADFGLVKAGVAAGATKSHVSTQNRAGTSMYMPMEYLLHGHVSEKTDSFAFGVVLVELLTGRSPTRASELLTMDEDAFRRMKDTHLDARAGEWPAKVLREVTRLAEECTHSKPREGPPPPRRCPGWRRPPRGRDRGSSRRFLGNKTRRAIGMPPLQIRFVQDF